MQKPTYAFDVDGHTVVEGENAKKKEIPWYKKWEDPIVGFGVMFLFGLLMLVLVPWVLRKLLGAL
jgi:hypothetical protein